MNILKNLTFFLGLVKLKIFKNPRPLTVIFNVTNRCNLRCKHCYASYYSRDSSQEMTTAQIKRLVFQFHSIGCRRISFSGGEPLLRKDISQLIDYVNSLGMISVLNTNGLLVPEFLNDLKNLDILVISLDGMPEHHDILREKGSGEKALFAIKQTTGAGIKVNVNMVLNRYNLDDIDYILDLANKYGFKVEFNLVISNIFGEGISNDQIKPSNQTLRKTLGYIIQKKKEGKPILFSSSAYENILNCWQDFNMEGIMNPVGELEQENILPDRINKSFLQKKFKCPAGKFFCFVDADGTVWPCPHLIGKVKSRNALKTGVRKSWKVTISHPCKGCYQVYHHEFSLLMNLNPEVLWNYFSMHVKQT